MRVPRAFAWISSAASVGLVALAAGLAAAHPGHQRSARLIEVDLSMVPATLKYGFVFELAESESLRRLADKDADGEVNAAEGNAEIDRLGAVLREKIEICVGASRSELACRKLEKTQEVSARSTAWERRPDKPLSLVWEYRFPVAPEARAIELRDAWRLPEVDRTDATIVPPEGARVEAATANPRGRTSATGVFSWDADRADEPRSFALVWVPPPTQWTVFGIVGAASSLASLRLYLTWKRRARSIHHRRVTVIESSPLEQEMTLRRSPEQISSKGTEPVE